MSIIIQIVGFPTSKHIFVREQLEILLNPLTLASALRNNLMMILPES